MTEGFVSFQKVLSAKMRLVRESLFREEKWSSTCLLGEYSLFGVEQEGKGD